MSEQIRLGTYLFNLVPDGVKFSDSGGKILFEKWENAFEEIKAIVWDATGKWITA